MTQLPFDAARGFVLDIARERNVTAEVYGSRSESTSVKAYQGEVSEFKLANRLGLGVRALVNGAWGYSYTENLSESALRRCLESAVENAALTAPEGFASVAAHPEPPHVGDIFGEGLSGVTVDQKVQAAIELERAAREADPRVVSVPYGGYSDGQTEIAVANTAGLSRAYKSNYAMQYAYPLVSESGQNKMSGKSQFTREFEQLDPTRTALEAVRRSLEMLGGQPAPSGAFTVVIDRECMATFLAVYSDVFSAKMVQEGKSPLHDKQGQAIGSSLVTVRDDATRAGGRSSRPFDAEGFPSTPVTLIENGVLQGFLYDTETAARAGVTSTGHASRYGYRGTVGIDTTNFFLEPGHGTQPDLLEGIERGVLLTAVHGTHAGANIVTGDFSLQADGFWIENGKRAHPLEVFTVAGNFLELLRDVNAVADDLYFGENGGTGAPSVRVKSLDIGGK
jgi:PmbA protein